MKTFKPMLICNEQPDLDTLNYPLLASTKLDGCRMLTYQGRLVTRSLKPVQNQQLQSKFEPLRLYSEDNNVILDGEIYAEGIPFQFIVSCFMTHDYSAKLAIKKWDKLCDEYDYHVTRLEILDKLKFYMFDCVRYNHFNVAFVHRVSFYEDLTKKFPDLIVPVKQQLVHSADGVRIMFKEVLDDGYEGLILKDLNGRYKCGRVTLKESLAFKVKPYVTLDAQIIGVKQATKVNPNAPKTINELGRSVTSKKQEDRILIPRTKTFTVNYVNECSKCNGSGCSFNPDFIGCPHCNHTGIILNKVDVAIGGTEAERDEIWVNKESYIGRWIEYKGLQVGMKDVPRHCNMIRWREDKDATI